MNASKNLKEAADTIASSPAALQLRLNSKSNLVTPIKLIF